jgi:hypothetical protein
MPPHMVIVMPELTGYGSIRHVRVSLALVPELVDEVRYMLPGDVPPRESRDLRRIRQGRATVPRAPSLRSLGRQRDREERLIRPIKQGSLPATRETPTTPHVRSTAMAASKD